jgi:hypothetical protein
MLEKILAGIFAVLLLICCSSDKDEADIRLSQEQLNAIVGTWNLVEYQVSPPQDVNSDGTTSDNLIEELPCVAATLVLTEEFRFSMNSVQVNVTQITGGAFGISCGPTSSAMGPWLFLNNQILLSEGSDGTFQLSGTTLTRTVGDDLPGVQKLVYQKQ